MAGVVNAAGLKTDYLWKEILTPPGLTNILENYAQIVEEKNPKTGRKKRKQVFPRYHQLALVRALLAEVGSRGAGGAILSSTPPAVASPTRLPGWRINSSA
jgi:type I site-specific restriction-modification system R (restriction) subunit